MPAPAGRYCTGGEARMSAEERESKIRALEDQLAALKRMRAKANGDGGRPRKRARHPSHGTNPGCTGLEHVARSAICNSYFATFDCPKGSKCELVCKATRSLPHFQRPAGWKSSDGPAVVGTDGKAVVCAIQGLAARRVASLSDRLASGAGPARAIAESLIPVRLSFLGLTGVKGGAPARTGGRREGPACRGATGGPALPRPP